MGILLELGITSPVLAPDTPAVAHQSQQGYQCGAKAGVAPRGVLDEPIQVGGMEGLAVHGAFGDYLHDPAGAAPSRSDVFGAYFARMST